jgi:hypothetical protein
MTSSQMSKQQMKTIKFKKMESKRRKMVKKRKRIQERNELVILSYSNWTLNIQTLI